MVRQRPWRARLRPGPCSSGVKGFLTHPLSDSAQGESESGDAEFSIHRVQNLIVFNILCNHRGLTFLPSFVTKASLVV